MLLRILTFCVGFSLFVGIAHMWDSDQREIFIYYDNNIHSSRWLPFNLGCKECGFDECVGNGCSKNNYYTTISKDTPKELKCTKICNHANITHIQTIDPLKNGFKVVVFVWKQSSVKCLFDGIEANETLNGIITNITYELHINAFYEHVKLMGCAVYGNYSDVGTVTYNSYHNIWSETLIFSNVGNKREDGGPMYIGLAILITFVSALILVLSSLLIIGICCDVIHNNKRKINVFQ